MRLVIALALVGLGISLYIWRKQKTAAPLFCFTPDCYRVIHSPYARLFGVPNGALGSLMFAALAVLATGMEVRFAGNFLWPVACAIAVAGVLLALYLTYAQLLILRAVCDWCLLANALIVVILVLLLRQG